jgi:hypothetical protein
VRLLPSTNGRRRITDPGRTTPARAVRWRRRGFLRHERPRCLCTSVSRPRGKRKCQELGFLPGGDMEFGTIRLVQRRARLLIASSSFLVNWAMNSTASGEAPKAVSGWRPPRRTTRRPAQPQGSSPTASPAELGASPILRPSLRSVVFAQLRTSALDYKQLSRINHANKRGCAHKGSRDRTEREATSRERQGRS